MAKRWQTIRVFISSTFRDMHSERDYLVKVVFSKLRERLEAYQYHLEDIDLRWGVTAEQADNDMALDLCLQQIDECRPFFVGILGERYGWVPKSFTHEAVSKYGWIQHQTGKSLTELEILYGVLRKKEMQRHAFFYFRNKAFIEDVPAWKQADVLSEDKESAGKLNVLKDAIRQADPPVPYFDGYTCKYAGLKVNSRILRLEVNDSEWETLKDVIKGGFVDLDKFNQLDDNLKEVIRLNAIVYLDELKAFGDRVYDQLWRAIKAEHNLPDTPPVDTLAQDDPLAYEAQFHERFIESRTRIYIGRDKIQRDLMKYIKGDDTVPCLVTGPSGSGKSAVLAKFAQTIELQNDDILLIPHFVGASPSSTRLRQMLRWFCEILKGKFHYEDDIPFDINKLADCFRKFISTVPSETHVVIVIDALNQMDKTDHAHGMNWLPTQLPSHVKIVASCIDDPDKQEEVLMAFDHRRHHKIEVKPLSGNECLEIVREVPSLSAKTLDPKQVGLLLNNKATDNPLFLLVALEELRGFGSFEHLSDRIHQFPKGQNANTEIFIQVIERLTDEFDNKVVEDVLCYLACSRNGMTERELLELVEWIGAEESKSDLFSVLRQLRPYLQYRGDAIDFFHRSLFKAVQSKYLDTNDKKQVFHARLAQYFRKKTDPDGDSMWRGNYPRGLSELPYHLSKRGDREGYENVLLDYCFMRARLDGFGVQPLIEDYTLSGTERNSPLDLVFRTLDLSRNALTRGKDQLAGQLFGRLLAQRDQRIQDLLNQAKRSQHVPWLRPLSDSLAPAGGPLIRTLEGHTGWVRCLSLTSDGLVVSGSWDHTLKVWDLESGECLRTLVGHTDNVESFSLTSDGLVVSGSWDRTLKVWDLESGECLRTLVGHRGWIRCLSLTSDGLVVSASKDNTLKVWDLESGECLRTLVGHTDMVRSLLITSDGRVVSGSWDNTLKVWDLESGECLRTLVGHTNNVESLLLTSNGCIISGSTDGTLKVWDIESGECLRTLEGHTNVITSLLLTSDGRVVSGSWDSTIKVWDFENGKCLRTLESHVSWVTSLLLTSDGRLVSASKDKTLKVWDLESGECLNTLEGHASWVRSLSLTSDGHLVSASKDNTLKVWSLESTECLSMSEGHIDAIRSLSLTSEGYVVSYSRDNTLKVWNLESGRCLRTLEGHIDGITSLSLTSQGRVVSFSRNHQMKVWDIESGECLRTLEYNTNSAYSLPLTSDGLVLSKSNGRTLKVLDLDTGECLSMLESHTDWTTSILITSDGCVVSAGGKTLKVWDLESGKCLKTLAGHTGPISCFSLTSNGRIVSSESNILKVWDLESGECLSTLVGHTGPISCFSLTSDDRIVSSESNILKVWDLESGECLRTLEGHTDDVKSFMLTSNGHLLTAGGLTLKVWDLESGECLRTLVGHTDEITSLLLISDGLAMSASQSGILNVWDLENGECIRTLKGYKHYVNFLLLTSEGRVVSGSHSILQVWDLESGECLRTLKNIGAGKSLSLTSDGRVMYFYEDRNLKVRDLDTGECLRTLEGHTDDVKSLMLTSNGHLLTAGGLTLKLWNLNTGQCLRMLEGHTDDIISFSLTSDGRVVSASRDNTLKVWDLGSGECLRTLEGVISVYISFLLAPDSRAVSASKNNTLQVWDLDTGECLRILKGHTHTIKFLSLTSDGRIVSASSDNTPEMWKAWDLESGECLRTLEGHTGVVKPFSLFSDDRAVSYSGDNTLKVWDIKTGKKIASFCGESGIYCCAVKESRLGDSTVNGSDQKNLADDELIIVAGEESGRIHFLKLEEPQKTKK